MTPVVTDPGQWQQSAAQRAPRWPAYPRAAFLVAPDALEWSADSASDNLYMGDSGRIDPERARRQHRALHQALAADLPVVLFPGLPGQPDGVFPNNVFATARCADGPRLLIGSMRHPQRRAEAERRDIRAWFVDLLGYAEWDLRTQPGLSELTGTLVVDRARGVGIAGLGPRCDLAGAESMATAFGLGACLAAPMAEGEYHANVVLSLLGGRAAVVAADGWAGPAALLEALHMLYGGAVIELDADERASFAGNCIALRDDRLWMSERAVDSLSAANRARLQALGFGLGSVALDEIEKAGGSLRCCVAEIF